MAGKVGVIHTTYKKNRIFNLFFLFYLPLFTIKRKCFVIFLKNPVTPFWKKPAQCILYYLIIYSFLSPSIYIKAVTCICNAGLYLAVTAFFRTLLFPYYNTKKKVKVNTIFHISLIYVFAFKTSSYICKTVKNTPNPLKTKNGA